MTPGAALYVIRATYAPGTPPGTRARIARAARAGATRPRPPAHHAPPYPVPAPLWRRTVEVPAP